ncbi:MAG TPA: glycosyltransferase [Xanthobacteraceae bacterium]|nr:glycosyltransferase [Xanthobacteraceae bacterium]
MSTDDAGGRARPRALPGATLLQIVPALVEDHHARMAADTAFALLRSGARAIIAGGDGPLVSEIQGFGAEWMRLDCDTDNPLRLRACTRRLIEYIAAERVDLVHARGVGAARSAAGARTRTGSWLVNSYVHAASPRWRDKPYGRALAAGDRIIAPSAYLAERMLERHPVDRERVVVIPRRVDTEAFNPAAVLPARITALRRAWKIRRGERVVLVPGRIEPRKGQLELVDVARVLVNGGLHRTLFVLVGNDSLHPDYARAISEHARSQGVAHMVRRVGACSDMPAAYAVADLVLVPAVEPPMFGLVAAEALATERPVIAPAVGPLPEYVQAPPQVPEDARLGWLTPPDDTVALARTLAAAAAMEIAELRAMGVQGRKFALATFAPAHIAASTLAVYSTLFEGPG